MWLQMLLTSLAALLTAPCVLQRACRSREPRAPPAVCMHRLHPDDNLPIPRKIYEDTSFLQVDAHSHILNILNSRSVLNSIHAVLPPLVVAGAHTQRSEDAPAHKTTAEATVARVLLLASLRVPLAAVLLLLPLCVLRARGGMTLRWVLMALLAACQAAPECKNCVMLGKEERAMFRAHSDACLAQSRAAPALVARLLRGEAVDAPALRRHVYCVLRRCKALAKDGKLLKTAPGKLAPRPGGRNATRVLESCAEQQGDSPEDLAWNLFRCGYDKKAALVHHELPGEPGNDAV